MSLVETYFELPHTVGVEFVMLGTDFVVDLDGLQLTIRFPRSEKTRNWPLLVPPALVNVFDDDGLSSLLTKVEWGMENGLERDGPESRTAWVSALGLAVEAPDGSEQEAANRLLETMDDFWPVVCDWIEVLNRQVHSGQGKALLLGPHHPVWVKDGDAVKRIYRRSEVPIEVPQAPGADAPFAVAKDTFQAMLGHAKSGPPPLEWLLIRDARLAHHAGSRRLAVIDAGTAAELAIVKMARDEVAGIPDKFVDLLFNKYQALNGTSQLLKKLGGAALPEDLGNRLMKPRNGAAHRGAIPTAEESRAALEAAMEIVDSAYPLTAYQGPTC
ncbi:hypothetical protein [Nocardioides sp. L-11A]|uniref:hypothetical protein n=1 Tax=Nocardioides sp. L-11A TaxID=3043848 RepID=UPI00249BD7A3|nr:hypothetical protein QJ852_00425 [Nocardioides sp. L-11A]